MTRPSTGRPPGHIAARAVVLEHRQTTLAERIAELEHFRLCLCAPWEAALALDVSIDALERQMRRAGRTDLARWICGLA